MCQKRKKTYLVLIRLSDCPCIATLPRQNRIMVTPVTEWVKDKPVHRGAANIWNFLKTKATRYILNKNIARAKCILQLQLINYLNRGSYSRWSLRTCCPRMKFSEEKNPICYCFTALNKQHGGKGNVKFMLLISDGNSARVVHAWRNIRLIGEKSNF